MNEHDDKELREQYGDLLEHLTRLRRRLDAQSFPGRAWSGPQRRIPRLVWVIASGAAGAAAAVILVTVLLRTGPQPPGVPTPPIARRTPATTASRASLTLSFTVPTDINPAVVGAGRLEALPASMPSLARITPSASMDWDMTTVSMPALE
jgi:hypothetical protein